MSKFKYVLLAGATVLALVALLVQLTKIESPVFANPWPTTHNNHKQPVKLPVATMTKLPFNQDKVGSSTVPTQVPVSGVVSGVNLEDQSREMHALVQQQMEHPSGDPARDISDQYELMVITTLGADFPQERLDQLMEIQYWASQENDRIDEAWDAGDVTDEEGLYSKGVLLRQVAKRMASVLTREEYMKLMGGMEPEEDPSWLVIPPSP